MVNYINPDGGVIVKTPQKISFDDAIRQITFCNKAKINENMKNFICRSCSFENRLFSDSYVENYCNSSGISYLGNIPMESEIFKNSDEGILNEDPHFKKISNYIIDIILKQ